jgi:hypothetical protein
VAVEKIEIPKGDRPGEVAPLDNELGEDSPNFVPVATMIYLCGRWHCISPS